MWLACWRTRYSCCSLASGNSDCTKECHVSRRLFVYSLIDTGTTNNYNKLMNLNIFLVTLNRLSVNAVCSQYLSISMSLQLPKITRAIQKLMPLIGFSRHQAKYDRNGAPRHDFRSVIAAWTSPSKRKPANSGIKSLRQYLAATSKSYLYLKWQANLISEQTCAAVSSASVSTAAVKLAR